MRNRFLHHDSELADCFRRQRDIASPVRRSGKPSGTTLLSPKCFHVRQRLIFPVCLTPLSTTAHAEIKSVSSHCDPRALHAMLCNWCRVALGTVFLSPHDYEKEFSSTTGMDRESSREHRYFTCQLFGSISRSALAAFAVLSPNVGAILQMDRPTALDVCLLWLPNPVHLPQLAKEGLRC